MENDEENSYINIKIYFKDRGLNLKKNHYKTIIPDQSKPSSGWIKQFVSASQKTVLGYAIYCSTVEPDLSSELIHVFIKAVCHLFERKKRESIANACRIPFLKADAEATRLRWRVAQCAHTNTEMQTCTQTYKVTNTHTKETHQHFWEHAGVFANGSFHRAQDLLQTEETAQGQCGERNVLLFTCAYSLNPSLSAMFLMREGH